jgi:hypothetical protein
LGNDPLFWFAIKHVPVLSYPQAKTFGVLWQPSDSFSFLCKLHGSCCKALHDRRVSTSFRFVNEPTNLSS